ncbi:MAG: hypothetical protein AAB425_08090, partial [Bdellovibrionota bacterium]
ETRLHVKPGMPDVVQHLHGWEAGSGWGNPLPPNLQKKHWPSKRLPGSFAAKVEINRWNTVN